MAKLYEDRALVNKIDRYVREHERELVEDLKNLVRIKSVREAAEPGAPFGAGVRRALTAAAELAASKGFAVETYKDMYALAHGGEGETEIGLFAHVDVVPEGNGWLGDPFEPIEREGVIIGRGVQDDKQAVIQGLYMMMAIRDLGLPFHSKTLLFIGSNEESGMEDVDDFAHTFRHPDCSFVSDNFFPVCKCEKNIASFSATADHPFVMIENLNGGAAQNVVLDRATATVRAPEAVLDAIVAKAAEEPHAEVTRGEGYVAIVAHGKNAHAATPQDSFNALAVMGGLLKDIEGLDAGDRQLMQTLYETTHDCYGEGLGIANEDDRSGRSTAISGMCRTNDGVLTVYYNARCCISETKERLESILGPYFAAHGFSCTPIAWTAGYYSDPATARNAALTDIYRTVTGKEHEPFVMGGGTYARHLSNAVVYGGRYMDDDYHLPAGQGTAHQTNEAVVIESLIKSIVIYTLAALEVDRQLHE